MRRLETSIRQPSPPCSHELSVVVFGITRGWNPNQAFVGQNSCGIQHTFIKPGIREPSHRGLRISEYADLGARQSSSRSTRTWRGGPSNFEFMILSHTYIETQAYHAKLDGAPYVFQRLLFIHY
jgi:hypothetical protein